MKLIPIAALMIAAAAYAGQADAAPVSASFTVTGSSGDWTLDFSFSNELTGAANQGIYFVGIEPDDAVTGSPAGWGSETNLAPWNNSPFGGSSILYNALWESGGLGSADNIYPTQTLSGFDVLDTSVTAPDAIDWFAYSFGTDPYTGGGNFHVDTNPGFEGVATSNTANGVPEPGTLALLATSLVGFGWRRRWRKDA